MAKHTLKANLSFESLSKLSKDFNKYKNNVLRLNEEFVSRLASVGIPIIGAKIAAAQGDSEKGYSTFIQIYHFGEEKCMARIVVENKDILFIEFGSGIHYNNAKTHNPKAAELGYGVGSYPGQTHAFNPKGWWYSNGAGSSIHSYGTEATAPMQSASAEIIRRVKDIASEVFGNGSY